MQQNKSEKSSFRVFTSPEDAGNALLDAVKSGDQNAILAIFGNDSKSTISSGDPVQDKSAADEFVSEYSAMHRWRKMEDGSQILVVGADNFPFPIPLKTNSDGKWFFDTAAGKEEIQSRRIGRNELAVIDICEGLVDAQAEYFSQVHEGSDTRAIRAQVHQRLWQAEWFVLGVASGSTAKSAGAARGFCNHGRLHRKGESA